MSGRKSENCPECRVRCMQQNTGGLKNQQQAAEVQVNVLPMTLKPNNSNLYKTHREDLFSSDKPKSFNNKRKSDTDTLDNGSVKRKLLQSDSHKDVIDLTNNTFESGLKIVPGRVNRIPKADCQLNSIFNNCDTEKNVSSVIPTEVNDEEDVNLDFLDDLDIDDIVETLKACAGEHENVERVKQVAIVAPNNCRESYEGLDLMPTADKNNNECTILASVHCEEKEMLNALKIADNLLLGESHCGGKSTEVSKKSNESLANEPRRNKKETSVRDNEEQMIIIANTTSKVDVKSREARNIQNEENKIIPMKTIEQDTKVNINKKRMEAFISPTKKLRSPVRSESHISDTRPTTTIAVELTSEQNKQPSRNEFSKAIKTGITLESSPHTKNDVLCFKGETKVELVQPKIVTENIQSPSNRIVKKIENSTESTNKMARNVIPAIEKKNSDSEDGQKTNWVRPAFLSDYKVFKFMPTAGKIYNAKCKKTGRMVNVEVFRPPQAIRIAKILEELKAYQESLPLKNRICLTPINIYDFGVEKLVVTQFYSRTLRQEIDDLSRRHECIKFHRLRHLCVQLVMAVFTLSCKHIVHADVNPESILLGANNQLKLTGFHLASKAFSPIKHLPDTVGTLNYRAPEIIIGVPLTSAIDMWASACVIYEMATSAPLFPGRSNGEVLNAQAQLLGELDCVYLRSGRFARRHWRPSCPASVRFAEPKGFFQLERSLFDCRPSDSGRFQVVKLKQLTGLLRGMLEPRPAHRSTIEVVSAHSFFTNHLYKGERDGSNRSPGTDLKLVQVQ